MSRKIAIIIVVLLLLVLSGFIYNSYGTYTAAKSITAKVEVGEVKLKGFNPSFKLLPDAVVITFKVLLSNPSGFSIRAEKIVYDVYIKGVLLGDGCKHDVLIPANSTTLVPLEIEVKREDALRVIAELLSEKNVTAGYQVKATLIVPVEFYGLVKVYSLNIPLEASATFT